MKPFLLFPLFALTIFLLSSTAVEAQTPSPLDEARAALKAGDLPKAAALLEPLTSADAKDAAAFHTLSQVRLAQRNYTDAVALAEKATVLDATKAAYFAQLGVAISRRMGELPMMQQAMMAGKLRKAFAKAVELDPNDLSSLIGLGRFYATAPEIAGGSLEKANEFAQRVLKIDPFLGEVELGNVADRDEKFADALAHYEAAAKLKPNAANVHALAGRMLAKLGRKDEARTRFESALKIQPSLEAAKQGLAALDAPSP